MASTPNTSRRGRDRIDPARMRRRKGRFMVGGILLPAVVVTHALQERLYGFHAVVPG